MGFYNKNSKNLLDLSRKSKNEMMEHRNTFCALPNLYSSVNSSPKPPNRLKNLDALDRISSEKLIKSMKFEDIKGKIRIEEAKLRIKMIPRLFFYQKPNNCLKPIDLSSIDSEDESFLSKNFDDPFNDIINSKKSLHDPFRMQKFSNRPRLQPITPFPKRL